MGCGRSQESVGQEIELEEKRCKDAWNWELKTLQALDARTKVPHLLVELRSLGFVEIQGKDTGGIYARLGQWLQRTWRLERLRNDIVATPGEDICGYSVRYQVGPLRDWDKLCDASYAVGGGLFDTTRAAQRGPFWSNGETGENNMGLLTMQLADFMTHECGWTLQVCDGGNLGLRGDIREQQVKFKAPHPLNLIAPLLMIELRQVGFIEVNGPDTGGIYAKLDRWLSAAWGAGLVQAHPGICRVKYRTGAFKSRGSEGENNMGLCTMQLVDFMVKQCAWTMVTCNASNFGRKGDQREQQLVFRNDEHVQHGENHIMVELRSVASSSGGYIEVNGLDDAQDLQPHLDHFMKSAWHCTDYKPYWGESSERFCDRKYTVPGQFFVREEGSLKNNLGKRTLELANCLSRHGWALQLCNGGSITPHPRDNPNGRTREQQVKFTRARTQEKAQAPLLMVELRAEPRSCFPTIPISGHIEISGPDTHGIYKRLDGFITAHMQGRFQCRTHYCDALYSCPLFRMKEATTEIECSQYAGFNHISAQDRLTGESNLGKWTMRLCDFMVDHVGEWDLLVCNSDNLGLDFGRRGLGTAGGDPKFTPQGVTAREMQLVFRHRPGGRAVFMSAPQAAALGRPPMQAPRYWDEAARCGGVAHRIVPGTAEELRWMQELMDGTFKAKATRDRHAKLADRFEVVRCLRSEHPALWDKFALRRGEVQKSCKGRPGVESEFVRPKTMAACRGLAQRCSHPKVGNPACQAYLFHGSNPTMAVSILGTSFKVDFAGKSAGTMFGPGIYMAESSSKSDEYATDDSGGEYDGLFATLVCGAVLGRPFVVEKAGDYAKQVTSGEYDCVVGDREKAVGTFKEFIFFHEGAVYPEYAVFYRRVYGADAEARRIAAVAAVHAP